MITKALKQKWLKALRSGKYKQNYGGLEGPDGYCVLGVLCKVAKIRTDGTEASYDRLNELLDEEVIRTLWRKNDTDELSFAELADFIEKEIP